MNRRWHSRFLRFDFKADDPEEIAATDEMLKGIAVLAGDFSNYFVSLEPDNSFNYDAFVRTLAQDVYDEAREQGFSTLDELVEHHASTFEEQLRHQINEIAQGN